jgi:hypothetical protein
MKKIFRLLVVVLLLGGWTLAAFALHVVVAPGKPGRVIFVPKNQLGIKDTYVDTRNWTIGDVANHPAVTQRLLETGKADALTQVAKPGDDLVSVLNDAITNGAPTTQPAASGAHASRSHK